MRDGHMSRRTKEEAPWRHAAFFFGLWHGLGFPVGLPCHALAQTNIPAKVIKDRLNIIFSAWFI